MNCVLFFKQNKIFIKSELLKNYSLYKSISKQIFNYFMTLLIKFSTVFVLVFQNI